MRIVAAELAVVADNALGRFGSHTRQVQNANAIGHQGGPSPEIRQQRYPAVAEPRSRNAGLKRVASRSGLRYFLVGRS